jgi:hypothetical protein
MKIMVGFERKELNQMGYPVMVEMWDKVMTSGRGKRRYKEEFTERDLIRRYYNLFYGWYLRTGTPDMHIMKLKTYDLLNRAIGFFASF